MSDNTQEIKHSTLAILKQAREDIAITYWIQNKEFDYGNWDVIESLPKYKEVNVVDYNDGDTRTKETKDGKKVAAVTGVCSIGAVALATMTLYDVPLDTYSQIASFDQHTKAAGHLLADVVARQDPGYSVGADTEGETIANWNDAGDRTREQVLAAFDKAIAHPLIEAEVLWGLSTPDMYSVGYYCALLFTTEQEAQSFADKLNKSAEDMLSDKNYASNDNDLIAHITEEIGVSDWKPVEKLTFVNVPA